MSCLATHLSDVIGSRVIAFVTGSLRLHVVAAECLNRRPCGCTVHEVSARSPFSDSHTYTGDMKFLTIVLLCSTSSLAFQLPFKLPFTGSVVTPEVVIVPKPPRVAIVGAGAGGSSAAFWISKAKERFGIDVEIDVFERENYIGGSECQLVYCVIRNESDKVCP